MKRGCNSRRRHVLRVLYVLCLVGCGLMLWNQGQTLQQETYFRENVDEDRSFSPPIIAHQTTQKAALNESPSSLKPLSSSLSSKEFVVDILSIGSVSRLEYLEAQRTTFASHVSVRNFISVTEEDDFDTECNSNLTVQDVLEISDKCKKHKRKGQLRQLFRTSFANRAWLEKKKNPVGWMCAQTRPAQGLHKAMALYEKTGSLSDINMDGPDASGQPSKLQPLPDYLILMDDDTYYNMELFQQHFQNHEIYKNSGTPLGIAGCMVRSPFNIVNFTFPFGGFGFIMSKGYLQKLQRPIDCKNDPELCHQIQRTSLVREDEVFSEGMTVMDLVYRYATRQTYSNYRNWKNGFCLHSDWLVGYMTNFYNLSIHVDAVEYHDVPEARIWHYIDSELYAGRPGQAGRGNCDFVHQNCNSFSHVCHYSSPERMTMVTDRVKMRLPHKFVNANTMNTDSSVQAEKHDRKNNWEKAYVNHTYEKVSNFMLVVDIMSVGSSDRLDYQQAQRETFGSHALVRNFFPITEADDLDDSHCMSNLSSSQVEGILTRCRSHGLRQYFKIQEGSRDSVGWMCSQTRSIHGFAKVMEHYDRNGQEFPDLLILMHDDTYYNMHIFDELLLMHGLNRDSLASRPLAMTGCLNNFTTANSFYTFPSIELGLLLNRQALHNFLRPIVQHTKLSYFRDGMNLVELMNVFVHHEPYLNYRKWTEGNCFPADFVWGHIINKYGPARRFANDTTNTIEPFAGSIFVNKDEKSTLCYYRISGQCHVSAPLCHNVEPDEMRKFHNQQRNGIEGRQPKI